MFKDYKKYLSTSIKVYLFVLFIIFILKIVGLDNLGIDMSNSIINSINKFLSNYNIINIWYTITLIFYLFIMYCIICNQKNLKILIVSVMASLLNIVLSLTIKEHLLPPLIVLIDFIIYIVGARICSKDSYKIFIKRALLVFFMNLSYQTISLLVRNVKYAELDPNNQVIGLIMNFDYLLLMYITYCIYFERRHKICGEAGSFSLKKINLKKSLQKLQKRFQNNWEKFKAKDKVEQLTISIYIILSLIWNTLSVVLILIVALINNSFVECIFILTSFWLSKNSFGKPFHFNSMMVCFIVSNLSYYILNRITAPIGISIIIPILLGVGLSYISSKFVKKTYNTLYRGMPEDLFEDTILNVVEKDSLKYNICHEFYIQKVSDLSLSFKYNYSVAGIRKIKERVNEKIKELNN